MKSKIKFCFPFFLLGCLLFTHISYGQLKFTKFEEVATLQKIDPRPLVVFIHTDWCKYCQGMKNTTFKNNKIIEKLNRDFYFLDLNAEEKRSITFHGQIFKYKPSGNNTGVHALAEQLGNKNGKVSYPSLCFLNSDYEIIYQHTDFTDSKTLIKILERLK